MIFFKSPVLIFFIGAVLFSARPWIYAGEPVTLPIALAEALGQSPLLQAAEADIDAAKAKVYSAGARPAPELTLSPGIRRIRESDGPRHEFLGGVSLAQTFPFSGKRELLMGLAERNAELRLIGFEALRFQIAAAVRKTFAELLAAQNIVELRHQQFEAAETFRQAVATRAESGYASDFEEVKSQGDVIEARKLLQAAQGRIVSARMELNTLLGRDPDGLLEVAGQKDAPLPERPLTEWVARALVSNPRLRTQAAHIEIVGLNVRQARLARQPDITAGPSFEYSNSEQIFGVSVTIPLADKNYGRGELLAAGAEERKVRAETEKLRREIVAAVTLAVSHLDRARAQLALYSPAYIDRLKAVAVQAERSYAQNATSLLIYLDVRRTLFDTLVDQQEAVAAVAACWAELESAVGSSLESSSENSN